MYLRKISSFFLIPMMMGSAAFLHWSPEVVTAQVETVGVTQCTVIDGSIEFTLPPRGEGAVSVDDQLAMEIQLRNTSSYVYPGVRAGIALYESASDSVPTHWVLDDEAYQIAPAGGTVALLEADMSSVPAGTYLARPFVGQGDDLHLLGIAIRNGVDGEGFVLERVGEPTQPVAHSIEVNNGEVTDGSAPVAVDSIEVAVTTENLAATPLIDAQAVVGIIQGETPLGDAIRVQRSDAVTLIPTAERVTTVRDVAPEGGGYSVVSGLSRNNAFGPVEVINFQIGEAVPNQSWPYISEIVLSDGLASPTAEVIACIGNVGQSTGALDIAETVGLELILSDAESETLYRSMVSNEDAPSGDAFRFTPAVGTDTVDMTLTLMTDRFPSTVFEPSEVPAGEEPLDLEFVPVQTVVAGLTCPAETGCEQVTSNTVDDALALVPTDDDRFWFYAGIVLVAALLMYVVLRRLHPEERVKPKTENDEEMHLPE